MPSYLLLVVLLILLVGDLLPLVSWPIPWMKVPSYKWEVPLHLAHRTHNIHLILAVTRAAVIILLYSIPQRAVIMVTHLLTISMWYVYQAALYPPTLPLITSPPTLPRWVGRPTTAKMFGNSIGRKLPMLPTPKWLPVFPILIRWADWTLIPNTNST